MKPQDVALCSHIDLDIKTAMFCNLQNSMPVSGMGWKATVVVDSKFFQFNFGKRQLSVGTSLVRSTRCGTLGRIVVTTLTWL
jgi:hypothetical protein